MTDSDFYLDAISNGDPDAFALWVAVAEPRIRGSLKSFATTVDTESVMQECLLRVWQVAPRFKSDGKPDGLIRLSVRVARNLALAEVRKRRPDSITEEKLESINDGSTPMVVSDPELRTAIRKCREELPAKPRIAFDLRLAIGGLPDRALAEAAMMTLNTFLQNVHRARAALVECLGRHGINLADRS